MHGAYFNNRFYFQVLSFEMLILDDSFDLQYVSETCTKVQIIICKSALSTGTSQWKGSKPNESFWGLQKQSKTWKKQETVN